ncbi:DUF2799 domain-containing protein [Pseudoalteromonas aliena]|nr:DUF2799 domain-containing protein [Pseudoalteromonas aliena]
MKTDVVDMIKKLVFSLALITLSGCTSLSQEECAYANWQQLGYDHGESGKAYNQGIDTVKACREFGISPDVALYKEGYNNGLQHYCKPENGFAVGIRGESFNGVCNSKQFRKAWEEGNDRYQIEARKTEINNRLDTINRRLEVISNELSAANVSSNQRRELTNERRVLDDERSSLRRERSLIPLLNKLPSFRVEYEL